MISALRSSTSKRSSYLVVISTCSTLIKSSTVSGGIVRGGDADISGGGDDDDDLDTDFVDENGVDSSVAALALLSFLRFLDPLLVSFFPPFFFLFSPTPSSFLNFSARIADR